MISLQNGASVSHSAVIRGSTSRAPLAVFHDEPYIHTVGEPLLMLLPSVVVVPQPPPKPPTAMETAGLVGVSCKEMIERCSMNE